MIHVSLSILWMIFMTLFDALHQCYFCSLVAYQIMRLKRRHLTSVFATWAAKRWLHVNVSKTYQNKILSFCRKKEIFFSNKNVIKDVVIFFIFSKYIRRRAQCRGRTCFFFRSMSTKKHVLFRRNRTILRMVMYNTINVQ